MAVTFSGTGLPLLGLDSPESAPSVPQGGSGGDVGMDVRRPAPCAGLCATLPHSLGGGIGVSPAL